MAVQLKVGVARIDISYITTDEVLVKLNWEQGEESFNVSIDQDAKFKVEMPIKGNIYLASAIMTDWLDQWIDDRDDSEELAR